MQTNGVYSNGGSAPPDQLRCEVNAGDLYEYYPLGQYIVAAPGVCGGRPTFKYTRIEVRMVLAYLAEGRTIAEIVADYNRKELPAAAINEAILLASQTFEKSAHTSQKIAV
ncbi:MAG: DUF433 domain-containing protein [Caldilinea sp. CFX5]|nr:DUF433 domain-containing protein [Caldilinea sp. CFX5]